MGNGTTRQGRGGGILSALIDPLLLEGGRRVNKMADLIVEQHPGQYKKAQVVNNIRARINALRKRGYVLERDTTERRIIRMVQQTVSAPTVVQ